MITERDDETIVEQAALNLIAITIFTFVMSSLLGPLFHLSPAIPAIAAFSLLGLATVDTLGWQGQGSTLLLDWVAGFSPEHRARVLRHEAGHFLVAHQLGIPISGYTLTAWEAFRKGQPGSGGVSVDVDALTRELERSDLESGVLSEQLIDRYCTVWMAGIAAEQWIYGNAEGGSNDREAILALWSQLNRSRAEGALKQRWAMLQATTILQANEVAYNELVAAMEQRLSIEDCVQRMGQLLIPGDRP